MKCLYHSADLDGNCSGALIKMRYPECEMYGIDYGIDFPWGIIDPDEKIFMVDYSLQPFTDMIKLHELLGDNLIWIDHHISAILESEEYGKHIDGTRDSEFAACELVWNYIKSDTNTPTFVTLLGRFDVWDHTDGRVLPYQYGMKQYDCNPNNVDFWHEMFDTERVVQIINEGEIILRYIKEDNTKYAKTNAFETELYGRKCIAINKLQASSIVFNSVWDNTKYDMMVAFGWRNKSWVVTMYTDNDVDVSVIAKTFGGGGHKKAAGFQCNTLPFKLN